MRALVVGSTNVDLVLEVAALPQPGETLLATGSRREAGGKGANQAVALARLGAVTRFVSAVGEDDDGRWSIDQLAAEGLDLDVQRLAHPTGRAVVVVDSLGENLIVVEPGANAFVQPPVEVDADVVLLSLEVPLAVVTAAAQSARTAGVPVVLNAAPAMALPDALLRCVDLLVVNEHELLGTTPQALIDRGALQVVVTQGADGCLLVLPDHTEQLPARPATVLDTTGAGDCFAAALAFGTGSGWSLSASAHLALRAAALSLGVPGARGGFPTAEQLGL